MVVDGNAWGAADVLTYNFGYLEADGQTKLLASTYAAASDHHLAYLGLRVKSCEIKEVSVNSGMETDTIFGLA